MQARPAIAQHQLLPFLLNPNSYSHRPRRVQLVQTHSSFVFMAAPYVYKVKKPVNFGFLDFSTLEKRRHFCQRELELNRRLSPGAYLGVVAISLKDGRLTFGPGDQVVEYAVKMRKLSPRYFLHERLERGDVKSGDLDRVAATLKVFYESQEPTEEVEAWGGIERLKISTDENFRQMKSFVRQTLSRPAFETIRFYTANFYRRHAPLFKARIREKWIRDCHGDLHLEHIHLTPRSLHIYDCIEFNDRLRYVDVASDVAFLAMDLDYEGRPDLARHFVGRMSATLDDRGMLQLMDFYKCYRACVRGKVESLHSVASEAPEAERTMSAGVARRYFRLALQYPVAGSKPLVLIVMGRIASGKSTLARALGDELGWEVFSSDHVRKELAGFPLYERSSVAARSRLYSPAMTRRTYETIFEKAIAQVNAGRSAILDATFSRRLHRDKLRQRLKRKGIGCCFVEAQATERIRMARLKGRDWKRDEVSDARLENYEALNRAYDPPVELGYGGLLKVNTSQALLKMITATLKALTRLSWRHGGRLPSRSE